MGAYSLTTYVAAGCWSTPLPRAERKSVWL
jgi:hypothetical protein